MTRAAKKHALCGTVLLCVLVSFTIIKCCLRFLIILAYMLDRHKCSLVIDAASQKSIYVSEYCPKMDYCKEGTHVMCMFYDKDREMGPHCLNSPNITITPILASKLLEISNAIRSKLALGKEKGKGGESLPRAYGMLRLQWDEELATFAQVLANQCVLRHDLCRATKNFPNPGQTAGLVRYTYPDWKAMSNGLTGPGANVPGLNEEKLMYAIKQSSKSWYLQKGQVTSKMILNYPDWTQHPTWHDGKLYLEMITGTATHMGCGMSAYTEYTYRNNFAALHYNSIEVICNFSARPAPGTPVYSTVLPPNITPGSQCGCPVGYDEDEDCLCNENPNYIPAPKPKTRSCSGKNCVPSIVVLPIIAMEDAPLHKLKQYQNETESQVNNLEIFNEENFVNSITTDKPYSRNEFEQTLQEARNNLKRTSNNDLWKAQHQYFSKNLMSSGNGHQVPSLNKGLHHVRPSAKHKLKTSLFSKSNKFELPMKSQVIKDVLPRKDFSKVQNLVDVYINKKRSFSPAKLDSDSIIKGHVTSSSILKNFTPSVYTSDYKNFTNISNDKKVLFLLDDLEREVKHTDLDETEKKVLDDKLKKIYGRIINEPKNSIASEIDKFQKTESNEFRKYENNVNDHLLEELKRDAHRLSHNYNEDRADGLYKKDEVILNVDKRLMEKDLNSNDDLGILKTRLEKPITENENNLSPNIKYSDIHTNRNVNALVEYDHNGKANIFGEEVNLNENHDNFRKEKFKSEKYPSKHYDDTGLKDYTNHLDDLEVGALNYERRKYYQDKIDYLEQKIQNARENKHHNKIDRHLRPVQPDRNELPLRQTMKKSHKSVMYVPDRARSVHGF